MNSPNDKSAFEQLMLRFESNGLLAPPVCQQLEGYFTNHHIAEPDLPIWVARADRIFRTLEAPAGGLIATDERFRPGFETVSWGSGAIFKEQTYGSLTAFMQAASERSFAVFEVPADGMLDETDRDAPIIRLHYGVGTTWNAVLEDGAEVGAPFTGYAFGLGAGDWCAVSESCRWGMFYSDTQLQTTIGFEPLLRNDVREHFGWLIEDQPTV